MVDDRRRIYERYHVAGHVETERFVGYTGKPEYGPDKVAQATLIDSTQLFQQDDRGQFQAVLGIVDVVVRGKFGFHAGFARDGSDNDCGASPL